LGVLFETNTFVKNFDSHQTLFEKDSLKVRIVGVPYHGVTYDRSYIKDLCQKKEDEFLFVHMHLLASKEGGTLFEGEDILSYQELLSLDADVFAFGHWHMDQGITTINNKTIINVGSVTRGSLSTDDLKRTPSVVLVEFDNKGIRCTKIPLRVKDSKDVFDLEGRDRLEAAISRQTAFMDHMKDTLHLNTQISLVDTIRNMSSVNSEVKEKAISYLE
jgi:predicted phosphodiesterase